jgi:hypothetical protein
MDLMPDDAPEEATKLGGPLAIFRPGRFVLGLCWTLGVLAILVGLGMLIGFAVLLADGPPNGGGARGLIKLVFVALGALSIGIGLIRKARSSGGMRVFVCADGIVRLQRGRSEVMRWGDVNAVKRVMNAKNQELVVSTASQLLLVDREGRQMAFNETISGLRELRQMVEEQTLKFMLPPAVEAFQSGAIIGFGDASVSRDGLQVGRESLPWELFESAEVSKGRLIVYDNSNGKKLFGRVDVSKVSNVHVLLALAEYARTHRA